MAPEQPWESKKVGTGAPPVRLPYGWDWVLPYHAVSLRDGHPRYCMGIAILLRTDPVKQLVYRVFDPVMLRAEPTKPVDIEPAIAAPVPP